MFVDWIIGLNTIWKIMSFPSEGSLKNVLLLMLYGSSVHSCLVLEITLVVMEIFPCTTVDCTVILGSAGDQAKWMLYHYKVYALPPNQIPEP